MIYRNLAGSHGMRPLEKQKVADFIGSGCLKAYCSVWPFYAAYQVDPRRTYVLYLSPPLRQVERSFNRIVGSEYTKRLWKLFHNDEAERCDSRATDTTKNDILHLPSRASVTLILQLGPMIM